MSEPGIFEIINTTRSIKYFKQDPVPMDLIRKVLDAGTKAPSGENTQPWEFVVVTNREDKKFIQQLYQKFVKLRFYKRHSSLKNSNTPFAKMLNGVIHLAENLHKVPVHLLVCAHRDWPASIPAEKRIGKAPPPYASIYPCIQNILLASRALGLGATLTTIHHMFEVDMHQRFRIPNQVSIVALIPIGYAKFGFGPVERISANKVTHFEKWGSKNLFKANMNKRRIS
ncbi:MAG: oxidoreductase [Thermodesulfobacteriota bacterium]|nr:MAG: oxidoreductase [Thermodesulfobacteriota bacterium]